jgi:adenine deaminase
MSERPLEEVAGGLRRLERRLEDMGVSLQAPFMALSFLALSVIPKLKITDRGLIDVDRYEVVPAVL